MKVNESNLKVDESNLKVNESNLKVTWTFNESMNIRILLSWRSEVVDSITEQYLGDILATCLLKKFKDAIMNFNYQLWKSSL